MDRCEHGLLQGHPPPSAGSLLTWVRQAHGLVHPHVSISQSGDGWGLYCRGPIALGDVLFALPKTAVLSSRTSSLPPLPALTSEVQVKTSFTILHLALAVLHEFRLAADSQYYGYLQSLPRETVLIPVLWGVQSLGSQDGARALAWLQGTEAQRDLDWRAREGLSLTDITAFYTATCRLLPPTTAHPDPSPVEAFYHAYSLVSSRAFLIDLYHTVALCPLADVLNHSSSPHTSLASDEFVCHLCGSLDQCPHDFLNAWGIPRRLEHLPPNIRDKFAIEADTIEMRLEAPLEVHEELFNTYGEDIGDSKLLVEWGFIGNDYAGEGMTWAVEHLLSDAERRRSYEVFSGSGRLEAAFAAVHRAPVEVDGDDVLCSPTRPGSLSMSQTGALSIHLFGAICFSLPDFEVSQSPNDYTRIITGFIQDLTSGIKVKTSGGNLARSSCQRRSQVGKAVLQLLEERQRNYYKPHATIDELFEDLETNNEQQLSQDAKLQCMAMTLRINEQSLLMACRDRWTRLLAE